MKKLLLAGTALGGVGFMGPALAADLPVRAAPAVVPAFSWTGCYIGGNVGASIARKEWDAFEGGFAPFAAGFPVLESFQTITTATVTITATISGTSGTSVVPVTTTTTGTLSGTTHISTAPITSANHDSLAFIGGGQIGCDLQFAPQWLIGLEGAGDWLDQSVTDSQVFTAANFGTSGTVVVPGSVVNFQTRVRWLASLTGRLGYMPWEHWLLYGRGGAAWVSDRYGVAGFLCTDFSVDTSGAATCNAGNSLTAQRGSEIRFGWTAGLGLEYAFWNGWSARAEWDFYDFGKKSVTFTDLTGFPGAGSTDIRQWVTTFTVGINYRFGYGKGPAPVTARY